MPSPKPRTKRKRREPAHASGEPPDVSQSQDTARHVQEKLVKKKKVPSGRMAKTAKTAKQSSANTTLSPPVRQRTSRARKPAGAAQEDESLPAEASRKRSGRSLRDRSGEEERSSRDEEAVRPTQSRHRARPELPVPPPPSRAQNKDSEATSAGQRRKRGEEGQDEDEGESSKRPRRRRRQHDESPPSPSPPPMPYPHVVPHTRRVRQATISAKWSPLSGPSLAAISALLHLAHRPILQRLSTTHQREAHASAALGLIANRIASKVDRGLPFPPASMPAPLLPAIRGRPQQQKQQRQATDGGRESELDFEAVLNAKAHLERQLEPTSHAVEVLRQEKDRIEKELERDYETLRALETGARAQVREKRRSLKKAHALAPEEEPEPKPGEEDAIFTFDKAISAAAGHVFTDLDDDDDLFPLALQLSGHVDSMRSNLGQAEGILPKLDRSRAALQAVLLHHLDRAQYESVVLT
ncbi:hypothetical protein RJ55_00581 [Drechmeria coniospora]|nr:hypothetical protein RJ55_00581 [Drechmeria coniospora]